MEVIPLLQRLVSIDSVNPGLHPGARGEVDAAMFVADWCTERGLGLTGVRWEIYGHHADDPAQRVTEVAWILG